MRITVSFVCCFLTFTVFCQTKPLSLSILKNTEQRTLFCFDSTGNKTSLCRLDLQGFDVEFYKAAFDRKTKELHLVGRLDPGFADVGIYLSQTDAISFSNPLSRTSYDRNNVLSNDGFFDITIKVESGTKLYFYESKYLGRQFNLSSLLTSAF